MNVALCRFMSLFVVLCHVLGGSWSTLLSDYSLFKGRVWNPVLLIEFIAPWLFGLILKR